MSVIHVAASRSYDVVIERGALDRSGETLSRLSAPCAAAVISDTNVAPLYGDRVRASLEAAGFRTVSFVFPAGERHKTLAGYGEILGFLAENRLGRGDLVAALGGGVTGDMAGFAAATYMRGIRYVQLPTTLLAAVDSSVGGKTAVDLPAGKNLVGAFWQPSAVLCDPDTLSTLPEEVWRDGCGEVVKYALLGGGPLLEMLRSGSLKDDPEPVIAACVAMKRDIVAEDEFETGRRKLLNLGHTFGHAVEKCSGFTVSHGCAVAIGMAVMTRAAVKRGFCGEETLAELLALLGRYGLPSETDLSAEALCEAALSDKKLSGGRIDLIVPEAFGRCRIVPADASELSDWLRAGGAK